MLKLRNLATESPLSPKDPSSNCAPRRGCVANLEIKWPHFRMLVQRREKRCFCSCGWQHITLWIHNQKSLTQIRSAWTDVILLMKLTVFRMKPRDLLWKSLSHSKLSKFGPEFCELREKNNLINYWFNKLLHRGHIQRQINIEVRICLGRLFSALREICRQRFLWREVQQIRIRGNIRSQVCRKKKTNGWTILNA